MNIRNHLPKAASAFLLAVSLLLGLCGTALAADSTVTYDGNAREFVFTENGGAPDSLFGGFQDVMPGDTLTQTITIKNDAAKGVKVKLYLRSHGGTSGADFLSQLKLTVAQEGSSDMFAAPADENGGLTDWVYLGTAYSGAEIKLNLSLEVPLSLDDTYQNAEGAIRWEFMAEEQPVSPDDPRIPQTGDISNLWLLALILAASGILVIVLLVFRKKKSAAKAQKIHINTKYPRE